MISIQNLTKTFKIRILKEKKRYQTITAVDNINLEIKEGEIFGLIGPNGAGKTTTLKILSTLIIPDSGIATIDGYDVVKNEDEVKKRIGLLTGEFARSLYWRLSGLQNAKFFAQLRGIWKPDRQIDELFKLLYLDKHKNELVMKYSTGMKHKLALAIGLLNDPPVLFLDEPLTGIDPVTTYEIKDIIKNQFKEKTIIWSSHNLYEIEEMCDSIGIMNNGRIILKGNPEDLKRNYWDHTKIQVMVDKPYEFKLFPNATIIDKKVEIKTTDIKKTVYDVLKHADIKKVEIKDIKTVKPSLEEIFMKGVNNDR